MKQILVDEYIIREMVDALRMAANHLESRERETAMDRSIEYAERLGKWVLSEQDETKRPRVIPNT